jgi:hypothetical protein
MPQQDIATKVKLWLFPSLVTILGVLIWRDISEMKSDIKSLLAQSNVDKTRIDNLERVIYNKNTAVIVTPSDKEDDSDQPKFAIYKDIILTSDSKKKKLHVFLKRAHV